MSQSQNEQILSILRVRSMTSFDAINSIGCLRLASRINDLRNQGHQILTENVNHNGKRFARYHLVKESESVCEA